MSQSTPTDLSSKTILITGASSGLGMQCALSLAKSGARLALGARRLDRLEEVVALIEAKGGRAAAAAMDVANEASVAAAYDAVETALGPVHGVIANAGINVSGLADALPLDDFDQLMAVNVRGAFITAREGARRMVAAGSRQGGWGRVVLTASIGAHTILPGLAAYCASKAAVLMLGKCLAREWINRGINVNVVCPGYIRTELNEEWFSTPAGEDQIARFPRNRLMKENELNDIIAFLVSDRSQAVTGSTFTIDDGQSL
jgi:NAD(P)-dependent dehydrogenase (short-subunit alcohol dehydrogenase family)